MVELQLPKLIVRVRFPSSAPERLTWPGEFQPCLFAGTDRLPPPCAPTGLSAAPAFAGSHLGDFSSAQKERVALTTKVRMSRSPNQTLSVATMRIQPGTASFSRVFAVAT